MRGANGDHRQENEGANGEEHLQSLIETADLGRAQEPHEVAGHESSFRYDGTPKHLALAREGTERGGARAGFAQRPGYVIERGGIAANAWRLLNVAAPSRCRQTPLLLKTPPSSAAPITKRIVRLN
jgi:hypothetical protein